MTKLRFLAVVLLGLTLTRIATGTEPEILLRWDRAVCLVTETETLDKQTRTLSSAFVVSSGDLLVLVTAAHAARDTNDTTKILHRAPDTESRWILLTMFTVSEEMDPWYYHPSSDVATMRLNSNPLLHTEPKNQQHREHCFT